MYNSCLLKEGILKDSLPYDIVSTIVNNKTSLGNNPAIPDIYEIPFLAKITNDYFHLLKDKLKEIGEINVNSTDLYGALAEMIEKCKQIEKNVRPQLEKVCFNYIVSLFKIPEETVEFDILLTDNIKYDEYDISINAEDINIELNDVDESIYLKKEIFKRRILTALITGGAMDLVNLEYFKEIINEINPELYQLYTNIIILNNYLLFTKENIGINDKTPKQMGYVELRLGGEDEKTKIKAQGVIFPILINEVIKGLMELFISHGLPKNKNHAKYVLKKTDFLKSEPWNMRLGPSLWKLFSSSLNDISSKELPYLLKRVSMLDINNFNFLMKEIFAKTKKGKLIMSKLSYKAKTDMDYDKFVDKMNKNRNNKNIITDEYIKSDEL